MKNYKATIILLVLLFMISDNSFSQDYISINNSDKLKVEIIEIGSSYMTYSLWKQDGIKYRVNRSDLTEVIFDDSVEILFRDTYPSFTSSKLILKSRESGNYLLGEEWIGNFWALEREFCKNNNAAKYFLLAQKQKRNAKTLGISSLVCIGGGFLLGFSEIDSDEAIVAALFSIIIVGPLLGTLGIITKLNSRANIKNTEDAYGIRYVNLLKTDHLKDVVILKFGSTKSGIGLVLMF